MPNYRVALQVSKMYQTVVEVPGTSRQNAIEIAIGTARTQVHDWGKPIFESAVETASVTELIPIYNHTCEMRFVIENHNKEALKREILKALQSRLEELIANPEDLDDVEVVVSMEVSDHD